MNHMSIEQAILQTKIYLKKGEEKKARELCEKFIQIYPHNVRIKKIMSSLENSDISQNKIDDLINLYNQKEFKLVIKYAKNLIIRSPNSVIIWNLLAASYTETGSLEKAVTAFEKVKILKPDYVDVYNNLGFVFTKQRKFKKAIESFDKALFLKPDYAAAYFNKGNALKELNENQNAIEAYAKALSIQPNLVGCYINMGNIIKDQGKLKEALISYEKALSLEPSNAIILQNIGIVLHLQGNFEESLDYYIKALSIDPNFENIYYNVAALLTVYTANKPNPKILEIISILIDKKTLIRPRDIMFLTINLLKLDCNLKKKLRNQYDINSNFLTEEVISELSEQTLLIKIMKICPITDLDIENLLTKLRAKILFSLMEVEISNKYYKFQTALAMQCFMNDYIYETSQNEIDTLKYLEEKVIESLKNNKQPDPQIILCLASYKPLYKYKWSYLINVNDDIKEVLTRQILEPLNENNLIKEIPTLENISNQVSSKVRKLYEINPYPKWVNLRIPKSEKIDKVFNKLQLDIPDDYINTIKEPNILVAGCGTGQHAIETASTFKDCKVLAIDLSYSSLAYAKRKTKELNIRNIKYMQADILQLNKLKNKFHIIECVGVLHHMEDPLKGWKILTNLLEPGGFMKIGLYSYLARQSITKFREKVKGDFVNSNIEDIRLIRKSILQSNVSEYKEILNFSDFFCLNEIKDLLFHPQEHRFTLPQIQKILDELNLMFCGFEEQNVISGFRSKNYSLKDMYNLEKWQAYEEANPKTFLNMYQFWCQKQTSSKNTRVQKGLDDLNNSYQNKVQQNLPQIEINKLIDIYNQGHFLNAVELAQTLKEKYSDTIIIWDILGSSAFLTGKLDISLSAFQKVIYLDQKRADAFNNVGIILKKQGKFDDAIKSYNNSILIKPDYAEAYNNMGIALQNQGKINEAHKAYNKAISIKPDYAEPYYNLGMIFQDQGKTNEALEAYNKAISLKPNYVDAYNNIGTTLKEQNKLDEAIQFYKKALSIQPNYAKAYINIGNALKEQGKLDESLIANKKAILIDPNQPDAYSNSGLTLIQLGKMNEAFESFNKALLLEPNLSNAHFGQSIIYNLQGNLEKGFKKYEWRLKMKEYKTKNIRKNLMWDGNKSLIDKSLVVYEEQGLGDIIQFCRYLILLKEKGTKLTFVVKKRMHSLLKTLGSDIILKDKLEDNELIDFEASLMSLPHLLNTKLENIPSKKFYLSPNTDKIISWGKILNKNTFKIGICWQGSKGKVDIGRSFNLSLFRDISEISNIELISLHKGEGEDQIKNVNFELTTLGSDFDSGEDAFIDTAAVMANCNLIITSDTAIAHLAGALGCQTWVVLKQIPDWRWMLDTNDCPWYPSIRLYRQKQRGVWKDVFNIMKMDLLKLLEKEG